MGNSNSNDRSHRYIDDKLVFIDSNEYKKTKVYVSNVLYINNLPNNNNNNDEITSVEKKSCFNYTVDSKAINNALLDDDVDDDDDVNQIIKELNKFCFKKNDNYDEIFEYYWNIFNKSIAKNYSKLNDVYNYAKSYNYIVVFRGGSLTKNNLDFMRECMNERKVIRYKSFMSTTFKFNISKHFSEMSYNQGEDKYKVRFTIYINPQNVNQFAYVSPYSQYKTEAELLIRPYRKFRINNITEDNVILIAMELLDN
eukprot:TRINITY_DN1668_c4_g1_i1.p1 TRINITY_DN1668_c4_g1~~TRINITY_DN1668_c4_g1_i1.p1  ORF type:complete len:254 (+),score=43.74 TRINITY_DN1668_c4_g1_i1:79-840(+)